MRFSAKFRPGRSARGDERTQQPRTENDRNLRTEREPTPIAHRRRGAAKSPRTANDRKQRRTDEAAAKRLLGGQENIATARNSYAPTDTRY